MNIYNGEGQHWLHHKHNLSLVGTHHRYAVRAPQLNVSSQNQDKKILIQLKNIDKYDIKSYIHHMKVTALLPDKLIEDVKNYSKGKNITESLKIALEEWLSLQKLKELHCKIEKSPLKLDKTIYQKIRDINRT